MFALKEKFSFWLTYFSGKAKLFFFNAANDISPNLKYLSKFVKQKKYKPKKY